MGRGHSRRLRTGSLQGTAALHSIHIYRLEAILSVSTTATKKLLWASNCREHLLSYEQHFECAIAAEPRGMLDVLRKHATSFASSPDQARHPNQTSKDSMLGSLSTKISEQRPRPQKGLLKITIRRSFDIREIRKSSAPHLTPFLSLPTAATSMPIASTSAAKKSSGLGR